MTIQQTKHMAKPTINTMATSIVNDKLMSVLDPELVSDEIEFELMLGMAVGLLIGLIDGSPVVGV